MFVGRCLDSARHDNRKSYVRGRWISKVAPRPARLVLKPQGMLKDVRYIFSTQSRNSIPDKSLSAPFTFASVAWGTMLKAPGEDCRAGLAMT